MNDSWLSQRMKSRLFNTLNVDLNWPRWASPFIKVSQQHVLVVFYSLQIPWQWTENSEANEWEKSTLPLVKTGMSSFAFFHPSIAHTALYIIPLRRIHLTTRNATWYTQNAINIRDKLTFPCDNFIWEFHSVLRALAPIAKLPSSRRQGHTYSLLATYTESGTHGRPVPREIFTETEAI